MRLLVTGGCGFIGSNFIRFVLEHYEPEVVTNVDALTYAGSLLNTADLPERFAERYEFFHADIGDVDRMEELFAAHTYYAVINFAAESHVDRSILSPKNFVHTNINGTHVLLEAARRHGVQRFVQISTDEVYGSIQEPGRSPEGSPLRPSSPYSASKAAADLLVLANHRTYDQDVVITRCSNNFGPYQFPEKLIPLMVLRALHHQRLPVYADGLHVREWTHVDDHSAAVFACLLNGRAGQIYNIGAGIEKRNIDLVRLILRLLERDEELIEFVEDRPGHDRRYALDSTKLRTELGWKPLRQFDDAFAETVDWYRTNESWLQQMLERV
jgi:dTDP-glucose 4,6-dehydratase